MTPRCEINALLAHKELFIFDLDGTLFNTLGDLAPAVNYAMRQFGLKEHDNEAVRSFIGNGSMNLIRRAICKSLNVTNTTEMIALGVLEIGGFDVAKIHNVYSEFYWEHCTENTEPYAGVIEFIRNLRENGKCIAMLTNKPVKPAEKILQKFDILDCFDVYLCGDTTPERKPSPAGIFAILKQLSKSREDAVMIGDDTPDIMAARNASIDCVTLLEGFGKPENLLPLQPKYTAGHIKDLYHL